MYVSLMKICDFSSYHHLARKHFHCRQKLISSKILRSSTIFIHLNMQFYVFVLLLFVDRLYMFSAVNIILLYSNGLIFPAHLIKKTRRTN